MSKSNIGAVCVVMLLACGGGQTTESKQSASVAEDLEEGMPGATEVPGLGSAESVLDGGVMDDGGVGDEGETVAPVTFVINNQGGDDLVFSTDKGWQPIIFAFSGKPPKAKSIILFPKFCTASCDVAAEERCPFCPEPEKVKEIRAAEKREVVAAGGVLEISWDAQMVVYERTRGKRGGRTKRCECYQKAEVPANTYTVRVCGLRVTKVAEKRSQLQCVDSSMVLPAEQPLRVELDFPDP